VADLFDEIALRVGVEWERAGAEIVADFQNRISTVYPPSSRVGEYPHLRTGNLSRSTHGEVEVDPNLVTLTVGNSAFYAFNLRASGRTMLEGLVGDWTGRLMERAENAAHRPG
jgi:hypothetical protein